MARSTVHYADNTTNNTLKKLHNKLRPAGTPVQRVEYIIELLLLRIFEAKLKHDPEFEPLRPLFRGEKESLLFSSLATVPNEQILATQHFADMTAQFHERAGMPKVNRDQLTTIAVTVPSIEIQEEAVRRYQREKNLLDELRRTIFDTQASITNRIIQIWEH